MHSKQTAEFRKQNKSKQAPCLNNQSSKFTIRVAKIAFFIATNLGRISLKKGYYFFVNFRHK